MSDQKFWDDNYEQGSRCVHCGAQDAFDSWYGREFGFCCECARRFVDTFSLAHSGAPFFGPRSGSRAPQKPVCQKTKWAVLKRDGFTCKSCGTTDRPLHVDHITPRAHGGSNDEGNLQALCDKCNLRKGAKL